MTDIKADWLDISATSNVPVPGVSDQSAADYNLHAARTNENTADIVTLEDALAALGTFPTHLTDLDTTVTGAQLNADHTKLATITGTNTGDQDLSGLVPKTTTVNTHPLSSNIALTQDDVPDGTTNKVYSATDKTRLASTSGTNTGDQTSVTGNAGTATALQTPRNINGVAFDGTEAITIVDSTAEKTANKGIANGYASLDGSGKLPASQLTVSALEYQGVWNATTNTPTLADGTGNTGDLYHVSVSGTQNLGSGSITFVATDYILYNGTTWEKSDTTDSVISVAGLTGAVGASALTDALTDGSTNKVYTAAEKTKLGAISGTNTGDQTSVSGNAGTATKLATARNIDGQAFDGSAAVTVIAPGTHAASSKATPVDADELPLVDSAASNVLAKLTWANLKATIKAYYDGVTSTLTNKRITLRTTTSNAPGATPTYNTDNQDVLLFTGIAANITSLTTSRSGTASEGDVMTMLFTDNGTARTIAYGTLFVAGTAPLAATTIVGSTIRQTYRYNAATSKYECIESVVEGAGRVKVTEYTCSSTTTATTASGVAIPAGAVGVRVHGKLAGPGGGSGRRGAAGTIRGGGGGGAGPPQLAERYVPIPAATTTYSVSLGIVGIGGAGQTVDSTDGNPGANPGVVSFTLAGMPVIRLNTGSLGNGVLSGNAGTATGATTSTVSTNNGAPCSSGGSGSSSGGAGGSGSDSWNVDIPTGAGGGGGISAADVANNGGIGGFHRGMVATQGAAGVVDTTVPTGGQAIDASGAALAGVGAGGGAASKTTAAQAGADGVGYGSPGGGGGASLNGNNSGKGGNGGPAYMRLEWVYA